MCIEEIRDIFYFPESQEAIDTVQNYRNYWRPKAISHILLAESHVWTSEEDLGYSIINQNENLIQLNNLIQNGYPQTFVRYVYCLAYGENDLLNLNQNNFSNRGTVSYWKLFYSCINDIREDLDNGVEPNIIFRDISERKTLNLEERITNKLTLLNTLKENGIWLVDSSIFGINYLVNSIRIKMIRRSWELVIQDLLGNIDNDFKILTIGKTVHEALEKNEFYMDHLIDVVDQPMAPNKKKNKNTFKKTYEFCSNLL